MVRQAGKIDKEIKESSVVNAKKFRQHLVSEFDRIQESTLESKYSVPYPALGFEVHYSVSETQRLYSDVKIKHKMF